MLFCKYHTMYYYVSLRYPYLSPNLDARLLHEAASCSTEHTKRVAFIKENADLVLVLQLDLNGHKVRIIVDFAFIAICSKMISS